MRRALVLLALAGCPAADHPQPAGACAAPSRPLLAQAAIEPPPLDAASTAAAVTACAAADVYACERLDGTDQPQLAGDLGARCGSDVAACGALGALQRVHDPAVAARALDRACAARVAPACSVLAGVLANNHTGPTASYDAAESAGWADGKAMMQPGARAEAAARTACDGSDLRGCVNLGVLRAAAGDDDHAAAAYRRGCDLGSPLACVNLGAMCEHGTGVRRDLAGAAALYAAACNRDSLLGCANLALALDAGRGVARDHQRADALASRICHDTPAGVWPDDVIAKLLACASH